MTTQPITVSRIWQYGRLFANDGSAIGTANSQQRLLRTITKLWLGDASAGWLSRAGAAVVPTGVCTVSYSCDSVAAGVAGDGVNRWDSDSDLVWAAAGNAHSWMVLRFPGLIPGQVAEACVDCTNATTTNLTVVVSPAAGFTGGTTLNRPTATDQYVISNAATWGAGSAQLAATVHAMISDDGRALRILVCRGNMLQGLWLFEAPTDAVTNWTGPAFTYINSVTNGILVSSLSDPSLARPAGEGPGPTTFSAYLTSEGSGVGGLLSVSGNQVPNDMDGTDQFNAVGIYTKTYPSRARPGGLVDLWMYNDQNGIGALSGAAPGCTSYPDDASRQFAQFGPIVVPWTSGRAPGAY